MRRTSVGWAVSTGLTAQLGEHSRDHLGGSTPRRRQVVERRRQAALLVSREPAARWNRRRRSWWTSSAVLASSEIQAKARITCSWSSIVGVEQRRLDRRERTGIVAPRGDGDLAHALDEVEDLVAGLFAHDVAEQPAEQADVVADRQVLHRASS